MIYACAAFTILSALFAAFHAGQVRGIRQTCERFGVDTSAWPKWWP